LNFRRTRRARDGIEVFRFMIHSSSTRSDSGFSQFSLAPSVLRGVEALGFEEPRPIQVQTIPAALAGHDVLGLAQTGTGKTAAFVLPILQRLNSKRRPGPRALIIAPTRELAMQIQAETMRLAQFCGFKVTAIFGGVGAGPQIRALRERPDILVACPGRLLDLMQQGHVKLGNIEVLVLDEADHMFDMGFLPSVRRILAALPAQRQNLLFSATMPPEVRTLTAQLLRQPKVVELAHSRPAQTIEHALYSISADRKIDLLRHLLGEEGFTSAIVFLRTKHRTRRLARQLQAMGHDAAALEGNMSQAQRDRAMTGFREGRFDVLVATDIAARGIDVANISHVINFDVPNTPDAYTHRIGRTGRAERRGKAFTFAGDEDRQAVRDIERRLGAPIRRLPLPRLESCRPQPEAPQRPPLPHVTKPSVHGARPQAGPRRQQRPGASARRRRVRASSW
jgi:ATP-dependent RNA helicase RhlE